MNDTTDTLTRSLPTLAEVDRRIGTLLRELHIARRVRRLAELADRYREIDARLLRQAATSAVEEAATSHRPRGSASRPAFPEEATHA
jgi:hypothetical protein